MGKTAFAQQDLYERINYLYQASNLIIQKAPANKQLSNFYVSVLSTIAKRGVLKLDPSIKRTLCKKCNSLLVPGVTCSLRLSGKRETRMVIKCLQCKEVKRFPCRPGYQLWSDKLELVDSEKKPVEIPSKTDESKSQ